MVIGTFGFIAAYKGLGIWADFQVAINKQGGSPLLRLAQRLSSNPLSQHGNTIPKDFSLVPLLIGVGWMTWCSWREKTLRWNSILTFGLLYASVIPPSLYLLGKFPTYYAWVLSAPISVVLCAVCWRKEVELGRKLWLPRGMLAAACLFGLPLQIAFAIPDWKYRDYTQVRTWAQLVLRPNDVALVDYPFYYAARDTAGKVYLYGYGEQLQPSDIEALTVVILSPHKTYGMTREDMMQRLGEGWVATGETRRVPPSFGGNDWQLGFLSLPNYDADVYRRRELIPVSGRVRQ